MTIDLPEISHATTVQALSYAMDYHTNHYSPTYPPYTYHRYDHSAHIEVLASWGYQGYYFVQSRIKLTVLYGLVAEWTDEIAMRGWIFWRNPITGVWHTVVDSQQTSVHFWQDAHAHIKQEAGEMPIKRARIDTYYPATHTADVTIYPLPGEVMEGVGIAQEIGPILPALLPDCTLVIFYDVEPPVTIITSIIDGVPPPWITGALVKDGEIAEADLAFDTATQLELYTHSAYPGIHHLQTVIRWVASTAPLVLTTTPQDIPGCVLTLEPGRWIIFGTFCFEGDKTTNKAIGTLIHNTSARSEEAWYTPNESKQGIIMTGQVWRQMVPWTETIKLQAKVINAQGTFTALSPHTTLGAIGNLEP